MTAKWDKENADRYCGIFIKYKKNSKDNEVIEDFKKVIGDSYINKIKNLLEIYKENLNEK